MRICFQSCVAAGLMMLTSPVASVEPPNVLLITIDDLNDWIGCLGGHPQAQTPHIDRLAQRGVLFTNAHCAAPVCNASRAALFSGRMPHDTGVWSNDSPRLPRHLPNLLMLPTAFGRAGYVTLGTGKLLHGGSKSNRPLHDENFYPEQRWSPLTPDAVNYTDDELPSKLTDRPRHVVRRAGQDPVVLPLNGMPSDRNPTGPRAESFDWGPMDVSDAEMGDTQITDWAIEHLREGFDRPFYLAVGYYRPHIPLWAPRSYFELYPVDKVTLPPFRPDDLEDVSATARRWALEPITAGRHATVVRHEQWRGAVAAYLACVSFVDHQVGRLLDELDASAAAGNNAADNTWIVLCSDHGWHLGEKQHWGKWTGWERSTRVPLIVVPPTSRADQFAGVGGRCDQPVSLVDIYPTLVAACGVAPPTSLDGQSLLPLLHDTKLDTDRAVLTSFDPGNVTLRTGRWRYVRYADGSEELYDHETDPHEWTNLAHKPGHEQWLSELRGRVPAGAIATPEAN